jgi:hypothetical protein
MDKTTLFGLDKAIGKLIKTEAARDALTVGKHLINETLTLHLQGTITVGEDSEYTPTVSIPYKEAFALFVRYCGVTREAAIDAMVKAMKEALTTKDEAKELIAEIADLEAAEELVQAGLEALPKQTKKGQVTAKVTIEEVK